MKNPAEFALKKRVVIFVLSSLLAVAGIVAYQKLGRLENPDFVIKIATVMTPYPGASPKQVEKEVTEVIEEAIQSMGQLKEVRSTSQEGLSVIYAEMKNTYMAKDLPQIWDELRRKVHDIQGKLPPGAGPSVVNDDFSDVYGLFYAISGDDGYTFEELRQEAKKLKKALLGCKDVAKIDFWGEQPEVIYIEIKHSQMSQSITPAQIFRVLQSQNVVQPSGHVKVDDEYIRITPTGEFKSEEAIGNLMIGDSSGKNMMRLRDVADIKRGSYDPPQALMQHNGRPAIGLGISTVFGGNAVVMGKDVKRKMEELAANMPKGLHVDIIYDQSEIVTEAVDGFMINLAESVAIVVILLMIFMGWRSGLLIGGVLLLTVLTTFFSMWIADIALQKISLGALILALGMLVDNAIVVAEGILIGVQRGMTREEAAIKTVGQTQWPLLGATFVAVLAFAAIGFAPGNVGEFCQTLFWVLAISLLWSWVFAVTITPLLCVLFLKIPKVAGKDPYDRLFFRIFRRFLDRVLHHWPVSLASIGAALLIAMWAFGFIPSYFFAGSTQPYFYIDYWRPEGVHIRETAKDMNAIEKEVLKIDGVESTTTFVGRGALRFLLSYDVKSPNASFGQLLGRVDDYQKVPMIRKKIQEYVKDHFPDNEVQVRQFVNGPPMEYGVEAQFRGPDVKVLRQLVEKAKDVFREAGAIDVRDDWRQKVRVLRPLFDESMGRRTKVTRKDLADALQISYGGKTVNVYREDDDLLPIIVRTSIESEKNDENPGAVTENDPETEKYDRMPAIQVYSSLTGVPVPLERVVSDISKTVWEYPVIRRENRIPTMIAQCNPASGFNSELLDKVKAKVEAIPRPPGYELEWEGEYKRSKEAQEPLTFMFPLCLLGMFIILICLFNSLREPIIIMLCVPLSIVGITAGLLLLQLPFGFMAILGFLGLSGMLIKNAIVLIDQINLETEGGKAPYTAILDSAVSRLRPVCMASGTTILGMTPLITDPFYQVMAATVASGLVAATVLTLFVVPLFFKLLFRVKCKESNAGPKTAES